MGFGYDERSKGGLVQHSSNAIPTSLEAMLVADRAHRRLGTLLVERGPKLRPSLRQAIESIARDAVTTGDQQRLASIGAKLVPRPS